MSLGVGKDEFSKYLIDFMTYLYKDGQAEIDVQIFPEENQDMLQHQQNERQRLAALKEQGWDSMNVVGAGEIAFNTNQVERKQESISTLSLLVDTMDDKFMPVARDACLIFIKNLTFLYEDEVKKSCAEGIPKVLRCVMDNNNMHLARQMWDTANMTFMQAIEADSEANWSCLPFLIDGLGKCIELFKGSALSFHEFLRMVEFFLQLHGILTKAPELWGEDEEDEEGDEETEGEGRKKERAETLESLEILAEVLAPYFSKFWAQYFLQGDVDILGRIIDRIDAFLPVLELSKDIIQHKFPCFVEMICVDHPKIPNEPLVKPFQKTKILTKLAKKMLVAKLDTNLAVAKLIEAAGQMGKDHQHVEDEFLDVCLLATNKQLVGTQNERMSTVLNLLACAVLHPPPGGTVDVQNKVGKIVKRLEKENGESLKEEASKLPLLKYDTIQKFLKE
uniref:Exportin(tRNA) n=1 Tax=Paramoeba aestuarina TaxID=180227 RepID=A0A7S4P1S2_9EUKA|mmetsp:Transcript_34577/g.53981  ORF Transcript_34577/g.53981 Transcript_34577/m.53981 type:complete len:449 (+) Transcript_34577:1-1347(+)